MSTTICSPVPRDDVGGRERRFMARYAAGDDAAFFPLFATLAPAVRRLLCKTFGGDQLEVDDVLQATFLRLHEVRAHYRPELAVRPWVMTIARRAGYDELRRQRRQPEILGGCERIEAVAAAADEFPLERREAAATVRRAVAQLSVLQRAVISDRLCGHTFREISQHLGTTEGAVKLRAFRAYRQLRDELAPQGLAA